MSDTQLKDTAQNKSFLFRVTNGYNKSLRKRFKSREVGSGYKLVETVQDLQLTQQNEEQAASQGESSSRRTIAQRLGLTRGMVRAPYQAPDYAEKKEKEEKEKEEKEAEEEKQKLEVADQDDNKAKEEGHDLPPEKIDWTEHGIAWQDLLGKRRCLEKLLLPPELAPM